MGIPVVSLTKNVGKAPPADFRGKGALLEPPEPITPLFPLEPYWDLLDTQLRSLRLYQATLTWRLGAMDPQHAGSILRQRVV